MTAASDSGPDGLAGVLDPIMASYVGPPIPHEAIAIVLDMVAAALPPWVAQQRAEALREAAADLPAETEGSQREGTARWPSAARDTYSLAIEEAQTALRARADRIAPTTEKPNPMSETEPDELGCEGCDRTVVDLGGDEMLGWAADAGGYWFCPECVADSEPISTPEPSQ